MADTKYITDYDFEKGTTEICIIYQGSRVLSLEYYGQLSAGAVEEYAKEAGELLIEKGVIKREVNRS